MSLQLSYFSHDLQFKFEAGTSRGVLTQKRTWILELRSEEFPWMVAKGEVGPLKGLSIDDKPELELAIESLVTYFNSLHLDKIPDEISGLVDECVSDAFPALKFGLECVLLDWKNGGKGVYFDNTFSRGEVGIVMNGLVWMGNPEFMKEQVEAKLKAGFTTIKMKVGAINFDDEIAILKSIREQYSPEQITLRVDANGAFTLSDVDNKIERLSELSLHSIEQPIKAGQWDEMRSLCERTPLPIALDEELIGIMNIQDKELLLDKIKPQMIILKPTLLGGFRHTSEWIQLAEKRGVVWWMTSALESNIGLTAIAQFTAEYKNNLPQGLGTGQLYHNNFESSLYIEQGSLYFKPS